MIDDDKLQFRSKAWETHGFTRKKGLKSFGSVNKVLCHAPSGLYLEGIVSGFDKIYIAGNFDSIKVTC